VLYYLYSWWTEDKREKRDVKKISFKLFERNGGLVDQRNSVIEGGSIETRVQEDEKVGLIDVSGGSLAISAYKLNNAQ